MVRKTAVGNCRDASAYVVRGNTLLKKATIHQVTTMLATSKNVQFPGHNLLTTSVWLIAKVSGHQYQWLAGGYDLEVGHFQKWLAWWLPGGQWFFVQ